MRVAVTGASGFIGRPLVGQLLEEGATVVAIGRDANRAAIAWDPAAGRLDPGELESVDAVVHLAGENIGQRWTSSVRRRIRDSRVQGTSLVARTLAGLRRPPRVLVSMSAVGIYGDRGDEVLDESSRIGRGYLAEIGEAWERSADPARAAGIRVVHPRMGIVLHRDGGALARMCPIFAAGVGGRAGSGRQWMSWISRDDAVAALLFALRSEVIDGVVNVTAPAPVRNAEFAATLGRVMGRPALLAAPAFAIRAAFGAMGVETVLEGQRVLPRSLLAAGFPFRHRVLESALRAGV